MGREPLAKVTTYIATYQWLITMSLSIFIFFPAISPDVWYGVGTAIAVLLIIISVIILLVTVGVGVKSSGHSKQHPIAIETTSYNLKRVQPPPPSQQQQQQQQQQQMWAYSDDANPPNTMGSDQPKQQQTTVAQPPAIVVLAPVKPTSTPFLAATEGAKGASSPAILEHPYMPEQ